MHFSSCHNSLSSSSLWNFSIVLETASFSLSNCSKSKRNGLLDARQNACQILSILRSYNRVFRIASACSGSLNMLEKHHPFPRNSAHPRGTKTSVETYLRYSSALKHLLTPQQWLLTHRMRSLHVIVCLLGRRAHEKLFLKAWRIIQSSKEELDKCWIDDIYKQIFGLI